jgi:hypothetical protein
MCGGVLGAFYNWLNLVFNRQRAKLITTKPRQLLQAVAISIFVSLLLFLVPLSFGNYNCKVLTPNTHDNPDSGFTQFYCPDGQYDDLASLTFK